MTTRGDDDADVDVDVDDEGGKECLFVRFGALGYYLLMES